MLAAVVCFAAAVAATVTYFWAYADRSPTSEEFRVYGVFLTYLEANRGSRPNKVALARATLRLSAPKFESSIPAALRSDEILPPSEFVNFCGDLCGRDFVRKNLAVWQLKPSAQREFGISIVEASESSQMPRKTRVIQVTRVGFDLWRNRGVLIFSASCNDYSQEYPILCVEEGKVCLQKRNGTWIVSNYEIVSF